MSVLPETNWEDEIFKLTGVEVKGKFPLGGGKPFKWCHYCEKEDHNDKECWSTRSREWKPIGALSCVCVRIPRPSIVGVTIQCSFCQDQGWIWPYDRKSST